MTLSRREFLRLTGITAASASLFGVVLPGTPALDAPEIIHGRTLVPTTLYTPSGEQSLWADTILNIREHSTDFYATDAGYVPREYVQPMTRHTRQTSPPSTFPFYAEVTAPTAAVREYADARAPLNTRIGHGGVMRITEQVENRAGRWYALTNTDGVRVGWSQAAHWHALPPRRPPLASQHIIIHRADSTLTAYTRDEAVFQTTVTLPERLHTGDHTLRCEAVGAQTRGDFQGVPYHFKLDDQTRLHGVYWHNRFGAPHAGEAIELNVLAAKWLYVWARDEVSVQVV